MTQISDQIIAIIGAGVAGLACARTLSNAGYHPTVIDKGRGLGGRLATRRVGDAFAFDHGAQFSTARSDEFQTWINQLIVEQAAAAWQPQMAPAAAPGNAVWYVGRPAMNSLVKPFAKGIDVRLSTQVTELKREAEGWRLGSETDVADGLYDRVICTAPAPQTREILGVVPEITDAMADVQMAPCWSFMLAFSQNPAFDFEMWRSDTQDIALVACNASKPGRGGDGKCWVIHASSDWSKQNLELDKETAAELILENLQQLFPIDRSLIIYCSAHRWRFAKTTRALGAPFLMNNDRTVFAGGDWCLGPRIECAFESGVAIAKAICGHDR